MDAAGLSILLAELVALAERVAAQLPAWCGEFEREVRAEQHWEAR